MTGSEPEAVDVLNDTDREADVPIMVSESMDVQNHSPSPSPQPSLADSSASSSLYATEMFTEQTDTSSPRQNIADVLEDGSDVSVGSSASSSGIYSKKEGEITTTNLLATSDVSPVVATLSESIGPPVSCPSKLPPDECVVIDDAAHRPNMNGLESDVRVDSNEAGSLIVSARMHRLHF